jgi:hypothetical protein
MIKANKILSITGLILFGLGILTGALFYGNAAWGDFEAYLFDPDNRGNTQLRALSCPVLISPGETGIITAAIHNPTRSTVKPILKANISQGFVTLKMEDKRILTLAPGETISLQWPVTAEEAAWDRFVLFKISSFAYPTPSQVGSCGVVVTHLFGLPGAAAAALETGLSLALSITGLLLWLFANRPLLQSRSINMLAVLVTLLIILGIGLISSFLGWWIVGGLCLLLSFLVSIVATGYFITSA